MTAGATVDPLDPGALAVRARELLEHDRWSREQLLAHQRQRLRALVTHAVEHSSFYREALGPDAAGAGLADLPTLPKTLLMEQFDDLVTDRRLRLAELEPFLAQADAGALFLDEYRVFSTSGTSGVPGVFVYAHAEFATWVALCIRSFERLGMTEKTRLVGIGAPGSLHLSRRVIAAMQAGRRGAPTVSVLTPLAELAAALDEYQPEVLAGYPSVIALLAEEQLQGRLSIAPRIVLTSSEVLTDDATARIEAAWVRPAQGYFSTEAPVIASDSLDGVGMHVCEEMIVEVVDEANRPVSPGTVGSKLLLTNLVNRAQPLIRYELSDAAELAGGPDPTGRPYDRILRIDGRSDDLLRLPGRDGGEVTIHPYRLRAPFVRLLDVLQYQIVRRDDGLVVRIVVRDAAPQDIRERVRAGIETALCETNAKFPVTVAVVAQIEREHGHGAKLKLVSSEVATAA
jgi:phenylacetate-coenzyme A ligase PaaK-like adenylate-forming protein